MRLLWTALACGLPLAAAAADVVIDGFEGPVEWTHHQDGGVRLETRRDTEQVKSGKAALRIVYTDAPPHWSNLQRAVTVPPNATAVAMWLRVHAAKPDAAMHFWIFEPDGDGWVAPILPRGRALGKLGPGWHEIAVPVSAFRFQPRGRRTRAMASANKMLIGCNFADLDVTIDDLRFLVSKEPGVSALPRTENLLIARGERGAAAILDDDLPRTAGAASPDAIAALTAQMGFGVTRLKTGDAADPAVLNRTNFDLLVVPCAPAYPRDGRKALLGFLRAGGALISMGGYAFDNLLVRGPQGWTTHDPTTRARDMDTTRPSGETINHRYGRPGDTMRLRPDQIAAFDPSYLLEHVAYAATAPDQALLTQKLRIDGRLDGYAACAMTGSNSPVFPDIHGRWTPLLNAYDSLGRLRGAAAAVVRHWAGPFKGSHWALFGVTNRDLIGGKDAGPALFRAALEAVAGPAFLHGLSTELACYRQGEPVEVSVQVTNHGRAPRNLLVRFRADGLKPVEKRLTVAAGKTETVSIPFQEARFARDSCRVTAELAEADGGTPIDRMDTAFVVWSKQAVKSGPKIAFKDNYFTVDGVPTFICGSNQTGMMWYSEHEDPLVWERDFALMQAHGMRMLRILHFSPFAAESPKQWGKQGVFVLKNRPKKLLRQTDAIVQLAQKHGVAIFLTLHDWMPVELSDAELEAQRDWARFWAARYRHVPGILYDVQNEPGVGLSAKPDVARFYNGWLKARYKTWDALRDAWGEAAPNGPAWALKPETGSSGWADVKSLDANRFKVETLNRWVRANAEGVKAADPDALTAVGYLQSYAPADRVLGTRHTDFSNMHYHAPVDPFPAQFKFIDRRFLGKSFSLGEFGAVEAHRARNQGKTGAMPDVSVRRFATMTHYAFGLGASFVLNWDWKDFDDCVFPWGLTHHGDQVPKAHLLAYRNCALFLGRLRPRYEDPGLCLLLPDSHRLGGRFHEVHRAIFRAIEALLANHVDFNVANEYDLDKLPPTCRAILWPVPYCPDDAAFARVLAFVKAGGALYLSGDVTYGPLRRRTRTSRLADLGLKDLGERPPFGQAARSGPAETQRAAVGKGKVFYMPRPIELMGTPPVSAYRQFLAYAGVSRIAVQPDHPRLHVFTVPLADGQATVLCNRTGKHQDARVAEASLTIDRDLTGMIATSRNGELVGLECTGNFALGGQPITTGNAHAMVASLDGRDIRHSTRLAVFPITKGTLSIGTAAAWRRPVLDVGQLSGPGWHSLAIRPLRPANGALPIDVDDALVRSILVLRERDAPPGVR